ncbi:MAG: hypothetical protein ABI876_09535 [Bacteroidota bacterium]
MLNDIFAASMSGHYETSSGGAIIERGTWSYRGFGSAEIEMKAGAERPADALRFAVELHSAERQIDRFTIATRDQATDQQKIAIKASIAGHLLTVDFSDPSGTHNGTLSFPDETIHLGPSPIWFIHLMLVDLIPTDRVITTPFIRYGLDSNSIGSGFYRVSRAGLDVRMELIDETGTVESVVEILLAEDGCPKKIMDGETTTEVVRLATALSA